LTIQYFNTGAALIFPAAEAAAAASVAASVYTAAARSLYARHIVHGAY